MNQFDHDGALLFMCQSDALKNCSKSAIRRALGLLLHALGDRYECSGTPALLAEQCPTFPHSRLQGPVFADGVPTAPATPAAQASATALPAKQVPTAADVAALLPGVSQAFLGPRFCNCVKGLGRTRRYCTAGCEHFQDVAR